MWKTNAMAGLLDCKFIKQSDDFINREKPTSCNSIRNLPVWVSVGNPFYSSPLVITIITRWRHSPVFYLCAVCCWAQLLPVILSSINNGSCFPGLSRDLSVLVKWACVTTMLGKIDDMGEAERVVPESQSFYPLPERGFGSWRHLDWLSVNDVNFRECGTRNFYHSHLSDEGLLLWNFFFFRCK